MVVKNKEKEKTTAQIFAKIFELIKTERIKEQNKIKENVEKTFYGLANDHDLKERAYLHLTCLFYELKRELEAF